MSSLRTGGEIGQAGTLRIIVAAIGFGVFNAGMIDHLRRAGRFFALIASVPFVVGFVGAWSAGFGFLLFILGIPAALIMLIAGTGLWVFRSFKLPVQGKHRALAISIAPVLLFVSLAVALPLLRSGSFVGSSTRLLANHGHYQEIIAKAEKSYQPAWFETIAASHTPLILVREYGLPSTPPECSITGPASSMILPEMLCSPEGLIPRLASSLHPIE